MESLEAKKAKKRKIILIITGSILFFLIVYLGNEVRLTQNYCDNLQEQIITQTDATKKLNTFVRDTLSLVIADQQSYVRSFKDSAVFKSTLNQRLSGQKTEVLSYVDAYKKRTEKNLQDLKVYQKSLLYSFKNDMKKVSKNLDSVAKIKVAPALVMPTTTSVPILVLPTDTPKVAHSPTADSKAKGRPWFRISSRKKGGPASNNPGW